MDLSTAFCVFMALLAVFCLCHFVLTQQFDKNQIMCEYALAMRHMEIDRMQTNNSKMGFKEALDWLINNDDCELIYVEHLQSDEPLSVVASFVADCYRKSDLELRQALIRRLNKNG